MSTPQVSNNYSAADPKLRKSGEKPHLTKDEKLKKMGDRISAISKENKALKAELEELRSKQVNNAELEELRLRVTELKETNNAMSLRLNDVESNNTDLQHRAATQTVFILATLKEQHKQTVERVKKLEELTESVKRHVIEGAKPDFQFYENVGSQIETERKQQSDTLQILSGMLPLFVDKVVAYKSMTDVHNELKTNNDAIDQAFSHLEKITGTPVLIRALKTRLDSITAEVTSLQNNDFLKINDEDLKAVKASFEVQKQSLNEVKVTFENIHNSEQFKSLLKTVDKIAEKTLAPISDEQLSLYEFYTTEGKQGAVDQLSKLQKSEQEDHIALRKWVSETWNSALQQIVSLECETNILELKLSLYVPLRKQHDAVSKLADDLRTFRTGFTAGNVEALTKQIAEEKGHFLTALRVQEGLLAIYQHEMSGRVNIEANKTLHDLIQAELGVATKQAELVGSIKNKATSAEDVEDELDKLHSSLHIKYERFRTQSAALLKGIAEKGLEAAFEIYRFEKALVSNGVFDYKFMDNFKTLWATNPYAQYWQNPTKGIATMTAKEAPPANAVPAPV